MWIFDSSINKKMNSTALLLVRVVAGAFMLTHGIQKYHLLMQGGPIKFADPVGIGEAPSLVLAIFAELVCSALLIIGFATRLITVPLIITMFVAVFVVHTADGFEAQELGGLYLLIYVLLFITGSGKYSIDGIITRKKRRRY
ncbi:DoxX family membrane protein [Flavobacterium sp. Sd200]|uniref:DoxX family protein n=1 Tax=Flavobacterium sp. Sd200 TaxID=2692211 RepID=UPI00136C6E59|nr:DoxX family protein [Flavobacterium sp. Sd200]MXN90785.1 DoxX family membrane protein [Flavobacterium sp. Sd200]